MGLRDRIATYADEDDFEVELPKKPGGALKNLIAKVDDARERAADEDDKSAPTELLIPRLETFLTHHYVDSPREPGHHCSEMFKFCARRVILDTFFPENRPAPGHEPRVQIIFDVGHALHAWFQNKYLGPDRVLWGSWKCRGCKRRIRGLMPKACRRCGAPRSVFKYLEPLVREPHLNLIGHCDGILLIEGEKRVLELKTINPKGFEQVVRYGAAVPAHIYQVNIYMHLLKMDACSVLYINKADSRLAEFEVPYDKRVWDDVESKLGSMLRYNRLLEKNEGKLEPKMLQQVRGICGSPNSWTARTCHQVGPCFALKDGGGDAYVGLSAVPGASS